MFRLHARSAAACGIACVAVLLGSCGSDSPTATVSNSTAHGTLAVSPPLRIASLNAATLQAQLSAASGGSELLAITGTPTCGVDFYYIQYWTVGAAGESTESSGALMVPTGAAPACSGPRPIVLYAHGTEFEKAFNIADVTNSSNTEGALIAAMFAAQGFTVVAPNFAGYDISKLGYFPFLNASQQSGEMMDALAAARTALPTTFASSTTDSGKLFITGYSGGAYAAMATQRAMEAAGATVSGAAPMSGPYTLEALFDAIVAGHVDLGSTLFSPLVTTSYQKAYGNVYTQTTDFYTSTYATGIDTLLPTTVTPYTALFANGLLPATALFDSTTPTVTVPGNPMLSTELTDVLMEPPLNPANPLTELFDAGFGTPFLVNDSVRVNYILDAAEDPDGTANSTAALAAAPPMYGLRLDLYKNDLRNGSWAPVSPTLLCGGENDPTVFFLDTTTMAGYWSSLPAGLVTVLDVDPATGPSGPFAAIQAAFQTSQQQEYALLQTAAGGSLSPAAAQQVLVQNYHGVSVPPFCALAVRDFFAQL